MDKYMLLQHRDEILAFLTKAPMGELGQIWQTVEVERVVYKIEEMDINQDGILFKTDKPLSLDEDHPVYINVNYKNFIFKLTKGEYRFSKNSFMCKFPQKAKAIESRVFPRTKIPKKANITLTLRSMSSETALDTKIILQDISEMGIGANIAGVNYDFFHKFSIFQVTKICERTVKEDTILTMRHMMSDKKTGRYKLGFQLSEPFSAKFHEVLVKKIKENLGIEE